ncbi:MAG: dihydrofolate reductase family protein [Ilumatobacteraceae bacterium]
MITSLDGYTADAQGGFDWAVPGDELHAFINSTAEPVGTHLYGRRMYETMAAWETMDTDHDLPPIELAWARMWQASDKVVYSTTLTDLHTRRTRLEREFDPVTVRAFVDAAPHEVTISGPGLAATALRAGIVDEIVQYVCPIVVGGGTPFLPTGLRTPLRLAEQRSFDNGVVQLRYAMPG